MCIHVDSALRGRQQFEVDVVDAEGRPAPVQSITANLLGVAVSSLPTEPQPDAAATGGRWSGWPSAPVVVPDTGVWTVDLDVTIDQTDAYDTIASATSSGDHHSTDRRVRVSAEVRQYAPGHWAFGGRSTGAHRLGRLTTTPSWLLRAITTTASSPVGFSSRCGTYGGTNT